MKTLDATKKPFWMRTAAIAAILFSASAAAARTVHAQNSGFDMGPPTTPKMVARANAAVRKPIPSGPFQPTWESIQANYKVSQWFRDAKFGLFMHWGVYSVPAYYNEWYEKHMYSAYADWHKEHFGPQDKWGYKDFIPLFTNAKFDSDAWAELFKASGARFVDPTAQHHDNFALWDSDLTPINAKKIGPKRDLIGDLSVAVRKKGLKFGVSNHGIENFVFINPRPDLVAGLKAKKADLYDPKWNDIYHVADRGDAACQAFLTDWVERNFELIDKYRPDMLWFDNGVNHRYCDPLKLKVAAYYYNRAKQWKKDVSLSTKKDAYAPSGDNTKQIGSIVDFEKIGARSPSGIRAGVWQVDEPIGSTWGYTTDMRVSGAGNIVAKLVDTVSKNGTLLLNLSPMADGTFAPAQQETLHEVGKWLQTNGEAIYGSHNWTSFSDGGTFGRGVNVRYTAKGDALYAIIVGAYPTEPVTLASLASGSGKVASVRLLGNGSGGDLSFTQNESGLQVKLPADAPCKYAVTLKITGLKINAPVLTNSGNPQ